LWSFYWNLYDWQPKPDLTALGLVLGVLLILLLIGFLAGASVHPATRGLSLVMCLALLALAFYVLPREPLTNGLFTRTQSSPVWYRAGRFAVLALPTALWSFGFRRRRKLVTMTTQASVRTHDEPVGKSPANGRARVAAICEVTLAFVLMHVIYRALKQFTLIGRWDAETNFTPGAVMIAFTVLVLLLCRRSFEAYGLGTKGWQRNLSLGLLCAVLMVGVAALDFLLLGFSFDATRPPDPYAPHQLLRILSLAAITLPAYLVIIGFLRARTSIVGRIPPAVSIPAIFALLAVLPLLEAHFQPPAKWFEAIWLFFGAGFGEETFFRGYMQSRVDQAFGYAWRLGGFEFGPGLFVSALFFGLIHALNTVDYFHGRFTFGWSMGLQSIAVGIFYGAVRARTGSILPGAIMHGLEDAFARIPRLLP
jgi:membrane protease YdiL (CAAX protease family)